MTVIVGIVCKDGIIIASDSQVEFERAAPVKRVNANKIYKLLEDRNIAIAGAGTLTFIHKAINLIRESIIEEEKKSGRKLSFREIIDLAESAMAHIYRVYNIKRLEYIYGQLLPEFIHPFPLMIGGSEKNNKYLFILHEDGISEDIEDYATLGSGAAYAEYLLSKFYYKGITTEAGKVIAMYVIKEIEKIDPNVGGPINIVVIKDRFQELDEEEIEKINRKVVGIEKKLLVEAKSLVGGLGYEKKKKK